MSSREWQSLRTSLRGRDYSSKVDSLGVNDATLVELAYPPLVEQAIDPSYNPVLNVSHAVPQMETG